MYRHALNWLDYTQTLNTNSETKCYLNFDQQFLFLDNTLKEVVCLASIQRLRVKHDDKQIIVKFNMDTHIYIKLFGTSRQIHR